MSLSNAVRRCSLKIATRGNTIAFIGARGYSTNNSDLEKPVEKQNILPVSVVITLLPSRDLFSPDTCSPRDFFS